MKPTAEQLDFINKKNSLTPEEAALYLDMDMSSVYALLHDKDGNCGSLPHVHIGKKQSEFRIYRKMIDWWFLNNNKGSDNKLMVDFKKRFSENINKQMVEPIQKGELTHE